MYPLEGEERNLFPFHLHTTPFKGFPSGRRIRGLALGGDPRGYPRNVVFYCGRGISFTGGRVRYASGILFSSSYCGVCFQSRRGGVSLKGWTSPFRIFPVMIRHAVFGSQIFYLSPGKGRSRGKRRSLKISVRSTHKLPFSGVYGSHPFPTSSPSPCQIWILPHPVRVTKTILRLAIPDKIRVISHALKAKFPDRLHGWPSLTQTEGVKGADVIFRIGGITGFHVLRAPPDAMKTVSTDRFPGGQPFARRFLFFFNRHSPNLREQWKRETRRNSRMAV